MNIRIGTELSVIIKGQEELFTACYIGENNKRQIVLTFPEERSSCFKKVKSPEKITVQFSDKGARYEFSTVILNLLDEPLHLAVLDHPSEIIKTDKRASDRINCLISAKLDAHSDKGSAPILGVIENINKTGCLCLIKEMEAGLISLTNGDKVNISCQFPGLVGEQSAGGSVARIRREKKDIFIGIHFDEKIWWVPPYERK
ncbi:MAG: flagellar brake domain-containing protein [Deltaproteobacteria bacterium]|nr:flagellar brake domain-containing protein [Deltaproteobacteria bacterium]